MIDEHLSALLNNAGLDYDGLEHLLQKLAECRQHRFSTLTIEVEKGRPKYFRGPTPSEQVRFNPSAKTVFPKHAD